MSPTPTLLVRVLALSSLVTPGALSYVSPALKTHRSQNVAGSFIHPRPIIAAFSSKNDGESGKDNYKFGDISRKFAKRLTSSVNKATGKETYEFGDLSRWLDKQAKAKASDMVGKEYEFGDLSRWVDARAKNKVNDFTGKERYKFGDLTSEIGRRAISGEVKLDDFAMLCKALVSFGVGLSPVAGALPVKLLIDMLNYSLFAQMGEKFVGAITLEIDKRMKEAVTGNPDYQLGDLTKAGIMDYIGKDEYSFGDVTRTVLTKMDEADAKGEAFSGTPLLAASAGGELGGEEQAKKSDEEIVSAIELTDPRILAELKEWDDVLKAIEDENEKTNDSKGK